MPADQAHRDRWRRYWDKHSASYDKQMRFFDRVLFGDSRAWVCSQATGDTLEVGIGTGLNLPLYPAGITLTGKRLGRHAEADGRAAAAVIEAGAAAIAARTLVPLPPASLPDKLYIAIDGTGVPMRTAETAGRPGKGEDGKARTREVKLACAFTQTKVDEDGYPVRDPGSSSYLATFAPAAGFGTLMAAEARRRGAGHVRQLTILGDGAAWIWNIASSKFPEVI